MLCDPAPIRPVRLGGLKLPGSTGNISSRSSPPTSAFQIRRAKADGLLTARSGSKQGRLIMPRRHRSLQVDQSGGRGMRLPFVRLVRWKSPQRSQRYVRSCKPDRWTAARPPPRIRRTLSSGRYSVWYALEVLTRSWSPDLARAGSQLAGPLRTLKDADAAPAGHPESSGEAACLRRSM